MYTLRRNRGPYLDNCKIHTARSRSERVEASNRVCTAKLTKPELEDLYYTLYDSNTQLKNRIYAQDDQIKSLNAKIQRLMNLHRPVGYGERDCCIRNNAILTEQKQAISELTLTNQRLSEKIKQLNRQICSTKQFLKGNGAIARCNKCRARITSVSYVNPNKSDTNVKQTVAVSCQNLNKSAITTRSVATSVTTRSNSMADSSYSKSYYDKRCDDNKCLCEIEELKQRTAELENELFLIQEKHLNSEAIMERQIILMRQENNQLKHINADLEQSLRELASGLRTLEVERCDLNAQLTLEKRRVAELETRMRLSCTSSEITRVLEKHLCEKIREESDASTASSCHCVTCDSKIICTDNGELKAPMPTLVEADEGPNEMSKNSSKNSDDSGYAEVNKNEAQDTNKATKKDLFEQSKELLEKMNSLQHQINALKSNALTEHEHLLNEQRQNDSGSVKSPTLDEEEDISEEQEEEESTDDTESAEEPSKLESGSVDTNDKLDPIHSDVHRNSTGYNVKRDSAGSNIDSGSNDKRDSTSSNIKRDSIGSNEKRESIASNEKRDSIGANVKRESIGAAKKRKSVGSNVKRGSTAANVKRDSVSSNEKRGSISSNKKRSSDFFGSKRESVDPGSPKQSLILDLELPDEEENQRASRSLPNNHIQMPSQQASTSDDKKPTAMYINLDNENRDRSERKQHTSRSKTDGVDRRRCRSKNRKPHRSGARVSPISPSRNANFPRRSSISSDRSKSRSSLDTKTFVKDKIIRDLIKNAGNFHVLQTRQAIYPAARKPDSISLKTYSLKEGSQFKFYDGRAASRSPDDTDSEISSLSDLPSEKEERGRLSLGEDRACAPGTSTELPSADCASLSEGEVPADRAESYLSIGENPIYSSSNNSKMTSPEKMKVALSEVSKEMLRCRKLLQLTNKTERGPSAN